MSPGRLALRIALATLGLAVGAAAITVVFQAMRSVMDVGGSCGSGGPYRVAVPCPTGVAWLLPTAIVGGLIGLWLYAVNARHLPGPRLVVLAWPALFLSLGWNFLQYGVDPPFGSGPAIGWLVCAGVFFVMGAAPLALLVGGGAWRQVLWADVDSQRVGGFTGGTRVFPVRPADRPATGSQWNAAPVSADTDMAESDGAAVATTLERLAAMHRRGELTDDEYAQAKRRVLGVD